MTKYWNWLPFPSPGDLSNPGIESVSPALTGGFFPTVPPGKPFKYGCQICFGYLVTWIVIKNRNLKTNSFEGGERKLLNLGLIEIEMLMGHTEEITGRCMLPLQM